MPEAEILVKSESISQVVVALNAAKKEFDPVLKRKENPGFKRDGKASKYADLEAAIEATEEPLAKNKLAVIQFPINEGDRVGVLTILAHESGEFIGRGFTLPLGKQDAQTGVAAVTYSRRTAYLAALSIAAEDDDGNTAAGRDVNAEEPKVRKVESIKTVYHANTIPATLPPHSGTTLQVVPHAEIPSEPVGGEKPSNKVDADSRNTKAAKVENPVLAAGGPVPDEVQLDVYRKKAQALIHELSDEKLGTAKLKPSQGLAAGVKFSNYLMHIASVDAVAKMTVPQWDTFFAFVDTLRKREDGLQTLVKLINGAQKNEQAKAI